MKPANMNMQISHRFGVWTCRYIIGNPDAVSTTHPSIHLPPPTNTTTTKVINLNRPVSDKVHLSIRSINFIFVSIIGSFLTLKWQSACSGTRQKLIGLLLYAVAMWMSMTLHTEPPQRAFLFHSSPVGSMLSKVAFKLARICCYFFWNELLWATYSAIRDGPKW